MASLHNVQKLTYDNRINQKANQQRKRAATLYRATEKLSDY